MDLSVEVFAIRLEAIATRLEPIASRLEAIAIWLHWNGPKFALQVLSTLFKQSRAPANQDATHLPANHGFSSF